LKVVYVTHESFIDHSYTIVQELQKKIDLVVFLQAKEETEEIKKWCGKFNAEFVPRKRFRNPLSLIAEYRFFKSIKKIKADNVWFNTLSLYQVIIAKLLFKKFLVMVHDVDPHPETKDYHSNITQWLTYNLLKKKICTASRTQADLFKQMHGFEPLVFQLPVINYFTEVGNPAENKRKNSAVRFFFFGSVEPYKGLETLLSAAELLQSNGIYFSINIYGKLKYNREELTERIKNIENIYHDDNFIDYKDIHSIYINNDILILPYKQVTQCGPLLIGYNELVPSICNDLAGFREYADEGKSALFFNGSADDLAEKMEYIIHNFEAAGIMKKYISDVIFSKFSIQTLAEEYILNLKK
jgi:glycosyltransferase involved in cell wall biosynthesis